MKVANAFAIRNTQFNADSKGMENKGGGGC